MTGGKYNEPDSNNIQHSCPISRFKQIVDPVKKVRGYFTKGVDAKELFSTESNGSELCEGKGSTEENKPV
jgi:hypothetical protein